MAKLKEYVVKESGFAGHVFKGRNPKHAFTRYMKKYGFFGGAVTIREKSARYKRTGSALVRKKYSLRF